MSEQQPRGRVRLFACGGTGINIAASLDGRPPKEDLSYAELDIAYLDTSKANLLNKKLDQARIYQVGDGIEEKDGAGKIRRTHFEDIKDCSGEILQRFPAGDLTIIISSLSGGSGSVIAPMIGSRLLKAGKPVIFIGIASSASKIELENVRDTLASYEGVVSATGAPVTMAYFLNSATTPRTVVDAEVRGLIAALMMLYSRQNAELDRQDLNNWLRFEQRTSFEPQLTALQLAHHTSQDAIEGDVISIATLTTPDQDATLAIVPEYHCQGYVSKASDEQAKMLPRHYYIASNYFARTYKALTKQIEAFKDASGARTKRVSILTGSESIDDSGIVV